MKEINGRVYPMWQQFLDRKKEWIGKMLIDTGDAIDRRICDDLPMQTEITDITLEPNDKDSAVFSIEGKDFSCSFDVRYGGISGQMIDGCSITFSGYGEHLFGIKEAS